MTRMEADALRIIPAYAGSTTLPHMGPDQNEDHPRIRGEHCLGAGGLDDRDGSSPHTRGALVDGGRSAGRRGIIPAYAGSTWRRIVSFDVVLGSSPHTRGAPPPLRLLPGLRGSSPHTRGALVLIVALTVVAGIIPAYAGSTFPGASFGRARPGSSPHTRGAHTPLPHATRDRGIIPAYAGSTRASTCPT